MRCGGCRRNTLDTDRMLVINSTNSANRGATITNGTPAIRSNKHHSACSCSDCITTRHGVAVHFHRLPNLQ